MVTGFCNPKPGNAHCLKPIYLPQHQFGRQLMAIPRQPRLHKFSLQTSGCPCRRETVLCCGRVVLSVFTCTRQSADIRRLCTTYLPVHGTVIAVLWILKISSDQCCTMSARWHGVSYNKGFSRPSLNVGSLQRCC